MNRDIFRERLFSRRSLMLGGLKGLMVTTLLGRLYFLQVVKSDKFGVLAEENRISLRLIPPLRGEVLDRKGAKLAVNKETYRAILVAEQTPSVEETLQRMEKLIGLSKRAKDRVLKEVRRRRRFVPVVVRENLSWEEVARLEVNAPDLPGLQIEVGRQRYYPLKEETAHLIGYVGAVSGRDMKNDPLLQLPDFRIGKTGIERTLDEKLRGQAGTRQVEVNALGRIIRELSREEGLPGETFELSVDAGLQSYIYERLGDEVASVVVMDVYTGEIHAFVSKPAYDPNLFTFGINVADWQALNTNDRFPLTNRLIQGQYAPASTFKLLVAIAALEEGWDPNQIINCRGHINFGDGRFHCWKPSPYHGKLNLSEAIAQSCDIYFYEIAKQLDIDKIASVAERFGLGAKTGIPLLGEKAGLVPSKKWKRDRYGDRWHRGETLVASIGQGYMLSTPVQLAVMAAQLANGGKKIEPRLFKVTPDSPAPQLESIGVSRYALSFVQRAMDKATNSQTGTAYWARIRGKGFQMAGKTGTAQVRRISMAEREAGIENKDLAWKYRHHALYTGYSPVDKPRFAVSVVVEHGGGGGAVAAPLARDILIKTHELITDDAALGAIT